MTCGSGTRAAVPFCPRRAHRADALGRSAISSGRVLPPGSRAYSGVYNALEQSELPSRRLVPAESFRMAPRLVSPRGVPKQLSYRRAQCLMSAGLEQHTRGS